jgi:hypothetical protein
MCAKIARPGGQGVGMKRNFRLCISRNHLCFWHKGLKKTNVPSENIIFDKNLKKDNDNFSHTKLSSF